MFGVFENEISGIFLSQNPYSSSILEWDMLRKTVWNLVLIYEYYEKQYNKTFLCKFCLADSVKPIISKIHHRQKSCHRCGSDVSSKDNLEIRYLFGKDNLFWITDSVFKIYTMLEIEHERISERHKQKQIMESRLKK